MKDMIVVGAGPGGSVAARDLATAGYSVQLFEADTRDRYKSCAGGIPPRCLEITPLDDRLEQERVIDSCFFCGPRSSITVRAKGMTGFTVWRTEFDQWIRDQAADAGAEVLYASPVNRVECTEDRVRVQANGSTHEARALVGAFGIGSRHGLLKQLEVIPPPAIAAVATELHLGERNVDERIGNAIETYMDSSVNPTGCLWIYPKREVVNVGVLASSKLPLKSILQRFIAEHPLASRKLEGARHCFKTKRFRGHQIPRRVVDRTFGQRFLLIGDAGGFADALTGEGIYHAQKTGRLAASVLTRALAEDDLSEARLSEYRRLWQRELYTGELAYSYRMADLLYGFRHMDALVEGFIEVAGHDDRMKECIIAMMSGADSRRDVYLRMLSRALPLVRALGWRALPIGLRFALTGLRDPGKH